MVRTKGVGGEPNDERRAVVLLEELSPKIQLVLEGQTGLENRLSRLESKVDENYYELHKFMMDEFKQVYKDFEQMGQRIDERFAQVDGRFAKMDERFVEVNSRLDTLTSRFDTHEQAHAG